MPTISSEKAEEDIEDLDNIKDLSPPKLMKVVDIGKDKTETDEKQAETAEKSEVKSEPNAPVLKVVDLEKSEPILEKMEAQLATAAAAAASTPVEKPTIEVKEKETKETKKKEPEKRGRKPAVKVEKEKEKEVPAAELPKKADKVKEPPGKVSEKNDDSPFDFKDEPEVEKEIKIRERKKPAQVPPVEEPAPKSEPEEEIMTEKVKEETTPLKGSKDDIVKDFSPKHVLFDEKDSAKSDSEVERRGRKKNREQKTLKEMKANISVVVTNNDDKVVNKSPERKSFVTLAEKKQGCSPMVRKVVPPVVEKCADTDSAKIEDATSEPRSGSPVKEEIKKSPEMVVVHKASPVNTDIVVGKNPEPVEEEIKEEVKDKQEEESDKDTAEVHSVKKKVRKKTKKKLEMEEQESSVPVKKVKRGPGSRKRRDSSNKDESAMSVKDTFDIDLHCEEEIRSRSASPENLPGKSSYIQESQGFVPRIETIDCRISDSQGSDSVSMQNDISIKSQSVSKSNMFENTPPTTPEHDSDESNQQNNQREQIKMERKSEESSSKADTSQSAGRESPNGNASPSNRSTGSSSGVIAGSEGSVDVPVYASKRKRETDETTPSKRRKRASRGKAAVTRARQIGMCHFTVLFSSLSLSLSLSFSTCPLSIAGVYFIII